MRARSSGGLMIAVLLALALPAAVSGQSSSEVTANNPDVSCEAPLPASVVVGDVGSTVWHEDEAEIDKVTLVSEPGAMVLDADWAEDDHQATISTTDDVSTYVIWSCAPVNGEPVQQNDDQDV